MTDVVVLHCTTNGKPAELIQPDSDMEKLVRQALPLEPAKRAQLLHDSEMLEKAHAEAADTGDTAPPPLGEDPGHAFIVGCVHHSDCF